MWPQNYCDGGQKERNGNPLRRRSVKSLGTGAGELTNNDVSPNRDDREVKCDESCKPRRSRAQPQCGRNKGDGADDEQGNQRDADADETEGAELSQAGQLAGASMCRIRFHGRRSKSPNEKS